MSSWRCGIIGCGVCFESPVELVLHQATEHDECTCAVCGESLPAGFLALRHAFTEHNRAEFVRAYGASSGHVRQRENVVEIIEERVDLPAVLSRLDRAESQMVATDD